MLGTGNVRKGENIAAKNTKIPKGLPKKNMAYHGIYDFSL